MSKLMDEARPPTTLRSWGDGPGAIAPDGSAVGLYTRLPLPEKELAIIRGALKERSEILELGAGAGRLTHRLVELGHEVVAVDESPEMLAHVHGARTIRARIQDLALDRRFDTVLLLSNLIDLAEEGLRRTFLHTCRRHVRGDGAVLLQRVPPGWFDTAAPSNGEFGAVTVERRDIRRPEPDMVSGTMKYEVDGMQWTQSFTMSRLDDSELAATLADADLLVDDFLTPDKGWIRAVPRPAKSSALEVLRG